MNTRPEEWYRLCQQHSEQLDSLGREYSLLAAKSDRIEKKLDTLLDALNSLAQSVERLEIKADPLIRDPETYEQIRKEHFNRKAIEEHYSRKTRQLSGIAIVLSVITSGGAIIAFLIKGVKL